MLFRAEINVMPLKALLDPQGKAITKSMKNLGLPEITNVRMGKHITLEVEAESRQAAHQKVETSLSEAAGKPHNGVFRIRAFRKPVSSRAGFKNLNPWPNFTKPENKEKPLP
jgi:phosphoribosylformylglycinamidine synthase subunit PurS